MTKNEELLMQVALGAGALGVIVFHEQIVNTTKDLISRGVKLTTSTLVDGLIIETPEELVTEAEATFGRPLAHGPYSSLDVYALARMARSEAGARDNDISRKVRMHVTINQYEAAAWARRLADLILYSKNDASRGFFGEQSDGPRRVATTRDPYAGDVLLAWEVMDERANGIDLSEGASNFVDVKSMGKQKGSGSYEALLERWGAKGLVPYQLDLPGLPSDFVLFRKA